MYQFPPRNSFDVHGPDHLPLSQYELASGPCNASADMQYVESVLKSLPLEAAGDDRMRQKLVEEVDGDLLLGGEVVQAQDRASEIESVLV